MLIALLIILYLLPALGYIVYCGYKLRDIEGDILAFLFWPLALPVFLVFAILRTLYLLGEWLWAKQTVSSSIDFGYYLVTHFFFK